MHRHRRDSNYHLLIDTNTIDISSVDEHITENTVYVNDTSVLTNVTTEYDALFDTDVYTFANGDIQLGTYTLGKLFSICTWVYIPTDGVYTLLKSGINFEIRLDTINDLIILRRLITDAVYEEFSIPCTVSLNQWTHLGIVRYYNHIEVVKNLVKIGQLENYYYDIGEDDLLLGSSFTGKLFNSFIYIKKHTFPGIYTDLDAFKKPLAVLNTVTENADRKLLDLHSEEIVSCSQLYPLNQINTYYEPIDNYWRVTRALLNTNPRTSVHGLCVVPPYSVYLTYPYTLEVAFYINTLSSGLSNIVIASQWYSANNRSWYLWFDVDTLNINFVYLYENTINQVTLDALVIGQINHFAYVADTDSLKLFFNGELVYTLAVSLIKLHRFHFNYDVAFVSNTASAYDLHKFTVTKGRKYEDVYLPYKSSTSYKYVPTKAAPYDYHYKDEPLRNKNKAVSDIELSGSSTISPNTSETYTVTLIGKRTVSTLVKLDIQLLDKTDLLRNELTIPATVTIPAGNLTATFVVQLANYAVNPYKQKFFITASTKNTYTKKEITVFDTREFTLESIQNLSGYLDGYMSQDSVTEGSIPNLNASLTASTSAPKVNTLHGIAYRLQDVTDAITFTERTNVRTALLIYRELESVPYRGYFGDSDAHTFNGGSVGQLLGNLIFEEGEFITALNVMKKVSNLKLSENNNTLVVVDEASYNVLVYERVSGIWSNTPTELDLGFGDNTVIINASLDVSTTGTVIAIGFPNANNGEGVVQIWRKVSGTWIKELHLGSPTPAPYTGGFGYAVCINDTGTRLFSTEIGSSTVHIFEKDTLWNPIPIDSLLGTNRFGYVLSCNSAGTRLYINEVDTATSYIYTFSTIWSLAQTINFGILGVLNKSGDLLILSDSTLSTVKVYEYTSTFEEIKTLSSSSNFGYSVAINNAGAILIGNPDEHSIYYYVPDDNYVTPTAFVSASLENIDFYGYVCSLSTASLVTSNFLDTFELITNDNSSVASNILALRQNYSAANKTDILNTSEPQILTFYTTLPLSIDSVGKTKADRYLNGLVYGWLLFSRTLSNSEIQAIELLLKKYLILNSYSLYDV